MGRSSSGPVYDYVIVGSGFGGSVSALRLSEKGYSVAVIEKGRRFGPRDFPETNWDVKRWMWMPKMGMRGIFQMSFFDHVTVLHGVGVGGGSLVYANTLPIPKQSFFESKSWAHLADWQRELEPHYATARFMLGAAKNPRVTRGDEVLQEIARDIGREDHFEPTDVAVYFGEPGKRVPDPYFDGRGPERVGCIHCGACMTGCRFGAKNTLDKNYLYLAERIGARVFAETEVVAISPEDGGYTLETRSTAQHTWQQKGAFQARKVIMAGGVLGTVPLLLQLKESRRHLPELSDQLGREVRTNSEALIGVIAPDRDHDFTRGVAITSILHTDEHSHIEPVRYGPGSSFFRTLSLPHSPGPTAAARLAGVVRGFIKNPKGWARALATRDWSRKTQILLYMRTLDGTLTFKLGRSAFTAFRRALVSELDDPENAPRAFMPEATDLAERFAQKTGGVTMNLATETLIGTPSTAHILGGCTMGESRDEGVINSQHEVFGYDGLYVIDGSAVSANPGVNPSLTITALAERAMSKIPARD